jgi:Flp pilus assembly protein TadD
VSLLLDALKEAEFRKQRPEGTAPVEHTRDVSADTRSMPLSLAIDPVITPTVVVPAPTPLRPPTNLPDSSSAPRVPHPEATAVNRPVATRSALPLLAGMAIAIVVLFALAYYLLKPHAATIPGVDSATLAAVLPPDTPAAPVTATPEPTAAAPLVPPSWLRPDAATIAPPRRRDAPLHSQQRTLMVAATPINVTAGRPSPLSEAYAALVAGNLPEAERLYGATLAGEPRQPDAHLGLAVIAQSRGDRESAARHYRAVLDTVPDHAQAWCGLANLAGDGDVDSMESRLRGLIAARPAAALHFALGNLLARQSRWSEAQESHFAAVSAAPENADYAFNLAVALDHLGKHAAASTYYSEALAIADSGQSVQFDAVAARQRLAELAPEAP